MGYAVVLPFDVSYGGLAVVALLVLAWPAWLAAAAVRRVLRREPAREVGLYMLLSVFNWFK